MNIPDTFRNELSSRDKIAVVVLTVSASLFFEAVGYVFIPHLMLQDMSIYQFVWTIFVFSVGVLWLVNRICSHKNISMDGYPLIMLGCLLTFWCGAASGYAVLGVYTHLSMAFAAFCGTVGALFNFVGFCEGPTYGWDDLFE